MSLLRSKLKVCAAFIAAAVAFAAIAWLRADDTVYHTQFIAATVALIFFANALIIFLDWKRTGNGDTVRVSVIMIKDKQFVKEPPIAGKSFRRQ